LGALLAHISGGADAKTFQPMNVNFGLFPEIAGRGKDRKKALSHRALADLDAWLGASRQDPGDQIWPRIAARSMAH